MSAVSLSSRLLGRKIKKFGTFFVRNVFSGILGGGAITPFAGALPGYATLMLQCHERLCNDHFFLLKEILSFASNQSLKRAKRNSRI